MSREHILFPLTYITSCSCAHDKDVYATAAERSKRQYYQTLRASLASIRTKARSFPVLTVTPDILLVTQPAPSSALSLDARCEMRVLIEVIYLAV